MAVRIFFYLLLIPAMLGLSEIIHYLKIYITKPKGNVRKYMIVYLKGSDCALKLKSVLEEYFWYGKRYCERILVLDGGIEDVSECESIARRNKVVILKEKVFKDLWNL